MSNIKYVYNYYDKDNWVTNTVKDFTKFVKDKIKCKRKSKLNSLLVRFIWDGDWWLNLSDIYWVDEWEDDNWILLYIYW